MILDKALQLSDAQAVTVTAPSTNVIDMGVLGDAIDRELYLVIRVNTTCTAAGAATVVFDLETDSAVGFGASPSDLWAITAVAKATLVAGYEVARLRIPAGADRYIRLNYTVATGPLTAGAFDAHLVMQAPANDL